MADLLDAGGYQPELVPIVTKGDKIQHVTLSKIGSKGGQAGGEKRANQLSAEARHLIALKAVRIRDGKRWTDKEERQMRKAIAASYQ